jgi:LysM repeat protein
MPAIALLVQLIFIGSVQPQNVRWTGEIALNHLSRLKALPLLYGVELIVETESDSMRDFFKEPSSNAQACLDFCRHQNWPPPVSAQRCGQWLYTWSRHPESLALLYKIANYYGEHYPRTVVPSLLTRRNVWLVSFLASGLQENSGDAQPDGPAGMWGLHPQRARVYGLRVDHDYDERFLPDTAAQIIPLLARDAGARPDLLITTLLLGPAAASALGDTLTDSLRRIRLGESYDVFVALVLAVEKISENLKVSFNPPLQPPWVCQVISEGSVCLESISRYLKIPSELLYYHNAHWRTSCLQPASNQILRLPAHTSEEFAKHLAAIRAHSDSIVKLRDEKSGREDSLFRKPFISTTEVRRYHTVRKGETLSSIARKYGLSREELRRLNKLRSDKITVGQKLLIRNTRTSEVIRPVSDQLVRLQGFMESPDSKETRQTGSSDSTLEKPQAEVPRWHTVKPGDTLGSIARRYGVSLNNLKKANSLSSDLIRVGQKIRIPY